MPRILIGLLLAVLCAGCRTTPPATAPDGSEQQTAAPTAAGDFTVTDAGGTTVCALTKAEGGYTVAGKSAGTLTLADGRVTLLDASGKTVGTVTRMEDGAFELNDAAGKRVAKMSPREGGYRVKDAADRTLVKIKPKDYGFKLGDDAGNGLGKVKRKGEAAVVETEDGTLLYTVTGAAKLDPLGVLYVKALTPLQRVALIVAAGGV